MRTTARVLFIFVIFRSFERNKDYNPWLMRFSKELETEYNREPDLWFKISLMLLFGVFVGIQTVHGVVSIRYRK